MPKKINRRRRVPIPGWEPRPYFNIPDDPIFQVVDHRMQLRRLSIGGGLDLIYVVYDGLFIPQHAIIVYRTQWRDW
jgi:hypothetical protein